MRVQNIVAVFLLLFCGVYLIHHSILNYDVTSAGGDFAEWVNNAYRFLAGDKPQKDFWLLFPAGEVIFPALMLKVFGVSLKVLIVTDTIALYLTVVVSVFMVWKLTKNLLASALILALMLLSGNPDVYFLFQITCAAFFIFYLKEKKNYLLLLCGIFAGISVWFRIYQSAPLIIAVIVTLCFEERKMKRMFLNFYLPILISVLGLMLYYADDFTHAMDELLVQSVLHNSSLSLPYFTSLKVTLRDDVLMWNWTISEPQIQKVYGMFFLILKTVEIAMFYFSPLLIPAFFFFIFLLIRERGNKPIAVLSSLLLFFTVWFMLFFPYGFVRAEVSRIERISPPLYFALIIISFLPGFKQYIKLKFMIAVWLTVLTGCIVFRIYGGRDSLSYSKYTVTALNGSYREASGDKAKSIETVLRLVEKNTIPNDYIFYDGFNSPPIYFLTGRKNPTYYDSMIDVVARPTDEKQYGIIQSLEQKQAKLYIHSGNFMYDKMPERSFERRCLILKDYLSGQHLLYADEYYEVYQLD